MPKAGDPFDCISPLDYRYWSRKAAQFLSENAFTEYKLRLEAALVRALHDRGLCDGSVVEEVDAACDQVTTAEVYDEEDRIGHDIRALVNSIQSKVSESARPFVHRGATSFDISDSANAARYKDAIEQLLIPSLIDLERVLINLTLREAETVQIGRTHGQHAVPITLGFALAQTVSRLGENILALRDLARNLPGKFSGAVGAYNASSLFFNDPEKFEREVLARINLAPAEISTQIVPPDSLIRLMCEVTLTAGILADLADDLRHLQRTEIGEVGEEFAAQQVGSSTMPQKRNPINLENVKSMWKVVVSRLLTVFMDQLSEHQRDLTNSASARTYGETIAYVTSMADRMTRTLRKLKVDRANLERNFRLQQDLILAEPLYIILASLGHPDAHEVVRRLTLQAQVDGRPLSVIASLSGELDPYFDRMTERQRAILADPRLYIGIAPQKARAVANHWLGLLG